MNAKRPNECTSMHIMHGVNNSNRKPKTDVITAQLITQKSRFQGPLQKYLAGEPHKVIDELFHDYLATGVSDRIHSAVGVVEEIYHELQDVEEDLLWQEKNGIGYTRACDAMKGAKDVLLALEDILSFILVDGMKLEELYTNKDFLFQKLWD
ncbi:uncharacterized protein BJ212DRAFT_1296405 [Suillus subaureus]|uniref:Uncharacterized protein n=1 Tax=Suillus subaureus TaxID=48587 RepID=A0A9P7EJR7_9AGAM|nr:uncharacterized protein BJ212DRAFT_1296405 [Suillus subaureus]KAG1823883.1 hypothetical protein BJ212DRAFT_1296405 [Suillus subaureus]